MAETVADLVEDTRTQLYGMSRPELNRVASQVTKSATTVTLEFDTSNISDGNVISIDDELMYVWAVAQNTKTLTVQRAWQGTEKQLHQEGALVEINPRFPTSLIRAELVKEIRSWSNNVFAEETIEVSVGAGDRSVNLTGIPDDPKQFLHVLRVLREPRSGEDSWFPVRFREEVNLAASDYADQVAIFLKDAVGTSTRLRVTYSRRFDLTTFDDDTELIEDIGLPLELHDIPPLGAAWRMALSREVKRTSTEAQGEPRNAAEVPPGHILQTARALRDERNTRLGEEARRLRDKWLYRK